MTARAVLRRAYAALALLLLVGPACFFGHKPAGRPAVDFREGEVALRGVNRTNLDVVIYLVHDGVRTRDGSVTGASAPDSSLSARSLGKAPQSPLCGQ